MADVTLGPAIAATSSAASAPLSTAPSAPLGPAILATSSAADASPLMSAPAVAAVGPIGPAVLAGSSAASASLPVVALGADSAVSEFVPFQAAAPSFAPAAIHFDPPAMQLFASFVAAAETFSAPAVPLSTLGLADAAGSSAAALVASVFSSGSGDGSDGTGGGLLVLSELPFMSDGGFDDTPVYTASSETAWILTADFSGDGWFFV